MKKRFLVSVFVALLLGLSVGSGYTDERRNAPTLAALFGSKGILINAVFYSGYQTVEKTQLDEAFQIINVSDSPISIAGWSVRR